MSNSIKERLTIPLESLESIPFPGKGRFGPLFVRECVPVGSGFTRVTRLHAAYVNRPQEALTLPWIERLPGEKRVRFVNGQIFVIQKYVGCQLIRAHISHGEEQRGPGLGETDCTSATKREVCLEHIR